MESKRMKVDDELLKEGFFCTGAKSIQTDVSLFESQKSISHTSTTDSEENNRYHKTAMMKNDVVSQDGHTKEPAKTTELQEADVSDKVLDIEQTQCSLLLQLEYGRSSVTHIYNPLEYAATPHSQFVRRYGNSTKRILFMGMNPGPYGMAQNGVPFGDITFVHDWLGISGEVLKPVNEHPKRPVQGFKCTRNEVSGTRFWTLVKTLSTGDPSFFFRNCYVHNYCPLCFMSASGKNVTPPMFKQPQRREFQDICDRAFLQLVELLRIEFVICVGKYVEERVKEALKPFSKWSVTVFSIMHPSPINPAANKGNWEQMAIDKLKEMKVFDIITSTSCVLQVSKAELERKT